MGIFEKFMESIDKPVGNEKTPTKTKNQESQNTTAEKETASANTALKSAKFCSECGAKVEGMKFCPECGVKLDEITNINIDTPKVTINTAKDINYKTQIVISAIFFTPLSIIFVWLNKSWDLLLKIIITLLLVLITLKASISPAISLGIYFVNESNFLTPSQQREVNESWDQAAESWERLLNN